MLCRNSNSWVEEENAYCTYCGTLLRRRTPGTSLFWILELLLVLVAATVVYLISTLGGPR